MNKLYLLSFLSLLNIAHANLTATPVNAQAVEPLKAATELEQYGDDLVDYADTEIMNTEQTSCSGQCVDIPMDLPSNGSWVSAEPVGGWTTSHGTPSVGLNNIWLWSYNNRGEGVNLQYSFTKGDKYCMQTVLSTKTKNNAIPNFSAAVNIILTPNRVANATLSNTAIPPTPSPNQMVFNETFASLPSGTATYVRNFVSNENFNNLWFLPRSPSLPQVEMAIRSVRLCTVKPCEQVKLEIKDSHKCAVVRFTSNIDANGGTIIGQTWSFGDGNYSNDANPVHNYNDSGSYVVQLTVHIKFGDECCTKNIQYKIRTQECEDCQQVQMAQVVWYQQGGQVIFHPDITHNSYFFYKWTFSDGTSYTTREVAKPAMSILWGTLEIYYADPSGDTNSKCCERKLTFKYNGKLQTQAMDALEPLDYGL